MQLVLASGSPYRRGLLGRLGYDFAVCSPDIDETRRPHETGVELAERLARDKADEGSAVHRGAFVIGSDQVVALGDEVIGKPGSASGARAQLQRLSGRTHQLITAVCVRTPSGEHHEETLVHEMVMRALGDDEIAAYVAEDAPHDCAGSYKIEAGGIRLFRSLRGDDYTGIVGLPLTVVRRLLHLARYEPIP